MLPFPIETDRLTLRPFRADDLDAVLGYYSLPEVARYLLDEPWTRAVAEEQIAKRVTRTGLDGEHRALALVVEQGGRVIGDVALWLVDDTGSRAEVGWSFHPDSGGQGYATEAVRALLDLAFDGYGLHRVLANLDPRNEASARLCERVGMTREAHLREDWFSKGEWTDNAIYGLLAGEWRASS
ncbi:GNAT family N-acetyltransferase [Nocardioides sp. TF02-7]|uniref:GNAT family N-acetyltransferase n=1 Tax=Nocardioides sp. TF02-7 TaxID=2917724 RepID=UPI001F05A25C|nr:GNAT family N-acetyltransferase [Nocardioides sp. TF02-7]UMG94220.1 GNAT family N-acetyltransferase [Nocardioides sp. TF02-7]